MNHGINSQQDDKKWLFAILAVSVVLVAVIFMLLYNSQALSSVVNPAIYILPKLNAVINLCVTLLLCTGYVLILQKKIIIHRMVMLTATVFSGAFLISYVTYHANATHTIFGDTDHNGILSTVEKSAAAGARSIYFIILITHIIFAALITPFILLTLYRALSGKYAIHKKIARITLPFWLYVSITGVIVYLMISPYYPV